MMREPFADDGRGKSVRIVRGVEVNDILKRRIVAYPAESIESSKSDAADDMMKAIVRENMGALATDTARAFPATWFAVDADWTLAPVVDKAFAWRFVDEVLTELAELSKLAGTRLYYGIENRAGVLTFCTYINQQGFDRTTTTPMLSLERGTLSAASWDEDHRNEINWVYSGGQGEAAARNVREVSDPLAAALSIWNRCEGFQDARNCATDDEVDSEGNAKLQDSRVQSEFQATLLPDVPGAVLCEDVGFGDLVKVEYQSQAYTMLVAKLSAVVKAGKETLNVTVENV
jgi:hypothetical protein